ncbi:hypothetical protein MsAg5_18310 [Methanosarcinaceae archaeon Ag5]|uniref:Uncharacterized protein n=2 Tax=Methanolapillus africanus TaxID=3028297 RepID=A0AAE4SG24_9EURY|nr:hypothetical protein [Methanosarcinaceae archaeon Ag5]
MSMFVAVICIVFAAGADYVCTYVMIRLDMENSLSLIFLKAISMIGSIFLYCSLTLFGAYFFIMDLKEYLKDETRE